MQAFKGKQREIEIVKARRVGQVGWKICFGNALNWPIDHIRFIAVLGQDIRLLIRD
jgi:hypothetical protein